MWTIENKMVNLMVNNKCVFQYKDLHLYISHYSNSKHIFWCSMNFEWFLKFHFKIRIKKKNKADLLLSGNAALGLFLFQSPPRGTNLAIIISPSHSQRTQIISAHSLNFLS